MSGEKKKSSECFGIWRASRWATFRLLGYVLMIAIGLAFFKDQFMVPIVIEREMPLAVFLATMLLPFIVLEIGGLVCLFLLDFMDSFFKWLARVL